MSHFRPLIVLSLFAALLVACSPSAGSLGSVGTPQPEPSVVLNSPDVTPPSITPIPTTPVVTPTPVPSSAPSEVPTPTAKPTATPAQTPVAAPTIVRAYFFMRANPEGEGVVAVLREMPVTRAVARAAMNALIDGPSAAEQSAGLSSTIPSSTLLYGISIKDGIATVDLSRDFESGGGSASARGRLAQVVFTLTQFSNVKGVLFQIDGKDVNSIGPEGIALDGPLYRADFEDQTPAILVDRPAWGAALGNPGRVTGTANVFEATFRLTLLDGQGHELLDIQVMATCGSGCRGTFDVTLRYQVSRAQWGTLRAWVGSARDGTPVSVREYPVWLTPGS